MHGPGPGVRQLVPPPRAGRPAGVDDPQPRAVPPPARLVVVETVYHQAHGREPTSSITRYVRFLGTDEEPYRKRFDVGPEWVQLPKTWIEGTPSCLVIKNEGLPPAEVKETAAEKEARAAVILELGVAVTVAGAGYVAPVATIRPGESVRFEPASVPSLRVRCPNGPVKAHVFLTPA